MHNIEQAIRHALQKIASSDPAIREQIYQAAWQTHEKTLVADLSYTEEDRALRRNQLTLIIQSIEAEYYVAVRHEEVAPTQQATPQQAAPQQAPIQRPAEPPFVEPAFSEPMTVHNIPPAGRQHAGLRMKDDYDDTFGTFAPTRRDDAHLIGEPVSNGQTTLGPEAEFGPGPRAQLGQRPHSHQQHNSWLKTNAKWIGLFVILLFVIWAFYNSLTGADEPPADVAAVEAPMLAPAEAPAPPAEPEAPLPKWIRIFDPANVATLAVRGAAVTEMHNDGSTRFFRIRANSAEDAAIIEIGEGVMKNLRGKSATFNVIARSAHEVGAQLSLTCDLGAGASCGRRRFEIPPTREDLLFSVDIPKSNATTGKLYITSDLLGEGNEVDIFSVSVHIDN